MYRLVYFKATNIIGFMSGLSRKTVEIDLQKFVDKDLIILFGDNASGKSTFLSLIHPWHVPTDGRTKFVIPGKEGTVIRSYLGDNGIMIYTKCVYTPKKNEPEKHNAKCFFAVTKPLKDEPEELNPTGNLASYQALLYTYFGLNKEYIGFATYNPIVSTIVKQSDSERKSSVGTMVPNTAKFEVSYNIINSRYKELRTLIRNVSDKLTRLRDEESVKADLKRMDKELEHANKEWKSASDKLAKTEGRLKELTKGVDVDEIEESYQKAVDEIGYCDQRLREIKRKLRDIYDKLDIDMPADGITFSGIDKIPNKIIKYEKKLASSQASLSNYEDRLSQQREMLFKLETDIEELNASIQSISMRDMDELLELKAGYEDQLEHMEYSNNPNQYANMSYDEIIGFSKVVANVVQMIESLYDEYGELVTQYFKKLRTTETVESLTDHRQQLSIRIETNSRRKDELFREFIEKDQYKRFKNILSQRPATCTIDTCPFIANALKWSAIADEAAEIKKQYEELDLEIIEQTKQLSELDYTIGSQTDINSFCNYVKGYEYLFTKYMNLTISDLYSICEKSEWNDKLNQIKLKHLAAVLSQKDLYIKLTTQSIPEIDHAIELAKLYGTNLQLLKSQRERLKDDRKRIKDMISELLMHINISKEMVQSYNTKLDLWKQMNEYVTEYTEIIHARLEKSEYADKTIDIIHNIGDLKQKIRKYKAVADELDLYLTEASPIRQKLSYDLTMICQLKLEKAKIEEEFLVIDLLRNILMPGKGIRKTLINIYMYDIYQTANQLLMNTFNGNLYLKEFIITDKEFIIPYVYNGTSSADVSLASSSQQSAIAIAISMAILSKVLSNYGIVCFDEADGPFSPANREIFIDILTTQLNYIGIKQAFFITHHPEEYSGYPAGFIQFPGGKLKGHSDDKIVV